MVTLEGTALHAGGSAAVTLAAVAGPLRLVQRGRTVPLAELRVGRTDRGVTLVSADGAVELDLCEHLLAALAGLGVTSGVEVRTDGSELPLLDGGAAELASALLSLGVPTGRSGRLEVARAATIALGDAIYSVSPEAGLAVAVDVDFPAPVGHQRARWLGDAADFLRRIAPARTFGWRAEHQALLARGRARGVAQPGLLVFTEDGVLDGCRPPEPDECARHKLLDLLGDLMAHGGLARGGLHAHRPGHAATHAFVAEAIRTGALVETQLPPRSAAERRQ
jgi:UDP-3-O-[3-hydroxymyristoyl] N-acetylglucosamine deacetylase